jgi:glycosyltransferase involved in cell wall biosynthesis
MNFDNQIVSIIVRTNQEKRLPLLQNALISIIKNDYRPIEIIIVAQSEQQSFIKKLENICQEFTTDHIQTKLVINRTSQDERAKNLNLGINAANGRYIGFLDDDDIIYPNHISLLLETLKKSELTAWVYSQSIIKIYHVDEASNISIISTENYPIKDKFSLKDLVMEKFNIPIHSYLIDRLKISPNLLYIDESLKVMEDYSFILKIACQHEPIHINNVTCEYRFYTNASNSSFYINQFLGINYTEKAKIWQEASKKIEKLKRELIPDYNPGLVSVNQRKFLLARFAFLYRIKSKFPRLWKFLLNLASKLKLI